MDLCRICLTSEVDKDIFQLQNNKNGDNKNYVDIIMFCLEIQVTENPEISTKLCLKCYKKIVAFYKFKTLALKNDAYLKSLYTENTVEHEVFLKDDIKSERSSLSDNTEGGEVKDVHENEMLIKLEEQEEFGSDNEFLSVIKNIKYEFVEYDAKDNAPIKSKSRKKWSTSNKSIENTKQICEECGVTVKDLKNHMYMHMPASSRKRIKCSLCDKTFATHSARYKHNKTKHLGIKQKCPLCNKVVANLKQHHRTIHDPKSLPYGCVPCGRRFISKSSLEVHMTTHTKDRPHSCELCDSKFASKTLLIMHKRRIHDKEKTHMCQQCSKSFFKKYHLQIHLRSHTKEKPYECAECGKFFSSSTTLCSHRLTHASTKDFACTLCTMTFLKPGYLRAHMVSHTKEKRYACQYCGVKFGRSDHRKRHERTAHERHLGAST